MATDDTQPDADARLLEALAAEDAADPLDPALLAAHPDESTAPEPARGDVPAPGRPDLPMRDEHAMPVVYYYCWKCKRQQYMAEATFEVYRIRGLHPFCLPCQSPDRFKWRHDPDTGREFLQPLAPVVGRGARPGEVEAQRLDALIQEKTEKELRRSQLAETIEALQHELAGVEARLHEVVAELPAAQAAFEAAQNDPDRGAKVKVYDLAQQLAKEVAKLTIMQNNAERRARLNRKTS